MGHILEICSTRENVFSYTSNVQKLNEDAGKRILLVTMAIQGQLITPGPKLNHI